MKSARNLPKEKLVAWGLAIYAVLSLISMATMSIGAGLLLLCLLIANGGPVGFLRALGEKIRCNVYARRFAILSMSLAAACVLSLIAASFWPLGFGGHFEQVHVLGNSAKLWYFAWPFALWFALDSCSVDQRRRVLQAWLGTFMLLSAIGVAQFFTGWPRPQLIPDGGGHFHATLFLGHHLSVASIFIFPFFALLDLKIRTNREQVLRWIGLALGLATLMFTFSRTLWIALPTGILVWALIKFGWRERIAILLLTGVAAGIAYGVPQVRTRLHHSMGIHEREDLWEANWRFVQERPLTGVGLRQNEELAGYYLMEKYHKEDVFQGHAHNDLLDVLSTTGIVGLAAFLAWWIFLFWTLAYEIRGQASGFFFGKGLFAALFVYQLNGLTQVNFWEGKVQHQLMWMVAWILVWSQACKRPGLLAKS